MTISKKITALTTGAALLLLAQGATLMVLLFTGLTTARDGVQTSTQTYDGLAMMSGTAIRAQTNLQAMLRESDIDKLDVLYTDLQTALAELGKLTTQDSLKTEATQQAAATLAPTIEATITPLLSGDKALATENLVDQALPAFEQFFKAVDEARLEKKKGLDESLAQTQLATMPR